MADDSTPRDGANPQDAGLRPHHVPLDRILARAAAELARPDPGKKPDLAREPARPQPPGTRRENVVRLTPKVEPPSPEPPARPAEGDEPLRRPPPARPRPPTETRQESAPSAKAEVPRPQVQSPAAAAPAKPATPPPSGPPPERPREPMPGRVPPQSGDGEPRTGAPLRPEAAAPTPPPKEPSPAVAPPGAQEAAKATTPEPPFVHSWFGGMSGHPPGEKRPSPGQHPALRPKSGTSARPARTPRIASALAVAVFAAFVWNFFDDPGQPPTDKQPAPAPVAKGAPRAPMMKSTRFAGEQVIVHTVAPGETLWDIAARYLDDPWAYRELAESNGISDPDQIVPGDQVQIVARRIR